jgi:hypothetical protein
VEGRIARFDPAWEPAHTSDKRARAVADEVEKMSDRMYNAIRACKSPLPTTF